MRVGGSAVRGALRKPSKARHLLALKAALQAKVSSLPDPRLLEYAQCKACYV